MSRLDFDAVIFDLDGVVTDTARVHAAAWKELFDAYLRLRESTHGERFVPFDKESDYLSYVDGKPRYEGVRSFLESRGIEIPYGQPSDGPDERTICGLGNRKNELFTQILERDGAEVFQTSVELIKELKSRGIRVAIVSSSKNCLPVIRIAGIEKLFDARVDGVVSATLGLKGKPNPDIFSESARILGVDVRRAAVVEDSIAGVEAGRAGNFGLVIGVDRRNDSAALREKGADLIVADLGELGVKEINDRFAGAGRDLPSALDQKKELEQRFSNRRVVVFLDYDGTLTPIVERPELAVISGEMREVVRRLAAVCTTAIVSGRSRDRVRDFVRVDGLIYAGSHGFDIRGPQGSRIEHEEGRRFLPAIDNAFRRLTEQVRHIPGALVENTGFSISVHYRLVADDQVPAIEALVDQVLKDLPTLRKTTGKKVFELRPKVDWHKGKAVLWILHALALEGSDVVPIYIGDDATDEDAFRAVRDRGVGILVAEPPRPTAASYRLRDTHEVKQFLAALIDLLK